MKVRRNRKRHPDLIARERNGEEPAVIAEEMVKRDSEKLRDAGIPFNPTTYPNYWEYRYIPYSPVDRIKGWVAARLFKLPH